MFFLLKVTTRLPIVILLGIQTVILATHYYITEPAGEIRVEGVLGVIYNSWHFNLSHPGVIRFEAVRVRLRHSDDFVLIYRGASSTCGLIAHLNDESMLPIPAIFTTGHEAYILAMVWTLNPSVKLKSGFTIQYQC